MILNKKRMSVGLLLICIFFSVLSNIPTLNSTLSKLNYVLWAITLLVYILCKKEKMIITRDVLLYIALCVTLFVYNYLLSLIEIYSSHSNLLSVILLPLLPYLIGLNTDNKYIRIILRAYIISGVFLAVWINLNYFTNFSSWTNSQIYVYARKNSAAQILSTAIILLLSNTKDNKYLRIIVSIYLFIIICFMQCRTAIISLAFAVIVYILKKSKHKLRITLLIVLIVEVLLMLPTTKTFLNHVFFIDKYSGTSVDTFSSGRIGLFEDAIEVINGNLLLGTGDFYVDNLYLNIIVNYGIILGLIPIIYIVRRLYQNIHNNICNEPYKKSLYYLSLYYIVTSFLEAYTPFGPGTCSLMFWFLIGMYENSRKETKSNELTTKIVR